MSSHVRVRFELQPDEDGWPPSNAEYLWAQDLGDGTFLIDNVPMYVRGISCDDVVAATEVDGELNYNTVVRRGGHSTYRVMLLEAETFTEEPISPLWNKLATEGCSYAGLAGKRLFAIDVPQEADIAIVYAILEEGLHAGLWDFEEANCQHKAGA